MPSHRSTYLEPTQDAGRDFVLCGIQGEVVMLNLGGAAGRGPRRSRHQASPENQPGGASCCRGCPRSNPALSPSPFYRFRMFW